MSANQAGKIAEDIIAAVLTCNDFVFTRQVPVGRTIYQTELTVDFVVLNHAQFPGGLILESKWQDVGGSVDEKFPYLVANIRQCYPLPVVIIAHGGGCRAGAVSWLRDQIDGCRLMAVLSLEEFMSWIRRSEKVAV